jgi:hypothetical protein
MKRKNKTIIYRRLADILRGNEGTSLVLVTIIAIIIVTCVIILRTTTSAFWASADKQYNQDRAYMLATSMGDAVDALIQEDDTFHLTDYSNANRQLILRDNSIPGDMPNAYVEVYVTAVKSNDVVEGYLVEIESHVVNSDYVYSAYYSKIGRSSVYSRQLV